MTNPFERLSATNPVPTNEAINVASLTRSVYAMTTPKDSQWRTFRLRMAGAVAGSAALMTGAIVLLSQAGSSFPVLDLASASGGHAFGRSETSAAMVICEPCTLDQYTFVGDPSLDTSAGLVPVYELDTSGDPTQAVAQALGVTLSVTDSTSTTATTNGEVDYTDANGDTYSYYANGGWNFSSGSTTGLTIASMNGASDVTSLENEAVALIAATSSALTPSDAQTSLESNISTSDNGVTTTQDNVEYLYYNLTVDGQSISDGASFSFDAVTGALLSAYVPIVSGLTEVDYPQQAPTDAVTALNTEADAARTSMSYQGTTQEVTLSDPVLHWSDTTLADGTEVLIPYYSFTGTLPDGSDAGTFNEVAVSSQYVNLPQWWEPYSGGFGMFRSAVAVPEVAGTASASKVATPSVSLVAPKVATPSVSLVAPKA